jgi:hypothetical protein
MATICKGAVYISMSGQATAQQDDTELAKQTQNPVADLISVPLQNNFNFGAGFNHDKMIYILWRLYEAVRVCGPPRVSLDRASFRWVSLGSLT